MIEFVKRISN